MWIRIQPRTPSAAAPRHWSPSLAETKTMAFYENHLFAAQLVAAEAVETVETKDHQNWELMALAADQVQDKAGTILNEACEHIQNEEDQRSYSSMRWTRGLWLESLWLQVVLPSSSEVKEVKR